MKLKEIRSFAQMENFCGSDVLSCILGLSGLEAKIFGLLTEKELEISAVARKINRDRTTVQRIVKNLIAIGIVSRRSVALKRGRKFIYRAISREKIKEKLLSELNSFYEKVKWQIDMMDEESR